MSAFDGQIALVNAERALILRARQHMTSSSR